MNAIRLHCRISFQSMLTSGEAETPINIDTDRGKTGQWTEGRMLGDVGLEWSLFELRRLPPPRLSRLEDRVHHRHVLDRIFQRNRNLAALQHRPGKRIALQRILVASRKRLNRDAPAKHICPRIDKDPRRPVHRRVERNFDLDSPARAEELHPLVVDKLRAAREDRLAAAKI